MWIPSSSDITRFVKVTVSELMCPKVTRAWTSSECQNWKSSSLQNCCGKSSMTSIHSWPWGVHAGDDRKRSQFRNVSSELRSFSIIFWGIEQGLSQRVSLLAYLVLVCNPEDHRGLPERWLGRNYHDGYKMHYFVHTTFTTFRSYQKGSREAHIESIEWRSFDNVQGLKSHHILLKVIQ